MELLSGVAYFRSHFYKMSYAVDHCLGVIDNAAHTTFACGSWHADRKTLAIEFRHFDPESLVECLLLGVDTWNREAHFLEIILKTKKVDLERLKLPNNLTLRPTR